jgi:hypothetical protein
MLRLEKQILYSRNCCTYPVCLHKLTYSFPRKGQRAKPLEEGNSLLFSMSQVLSVFDPASRARIVVRTISFMHVPRRKITYVSDIHIRGRYGLSVNPYISI